jgi:hypothetical protein
VPGFALSDFRRARRHLLHPSSPPHFTSSQANNFGREEMEAVFEASETYRTVSLDRIKSDERDVDDHQAIRDVHATLFRTPRGDTGGGGFVGYLIHQPAKPVGHWAVFRRNPNGGIVYLDSLEDGPVCVQSEDEVLNAIQDWHSQGYIIIAVGAHQNRSLAMAAAWNVVSKRVGLGRSSSNHVRQPKQSALKQPSPGGRRRRPSSFEGLPKNTRRVSFSKMNRIHPYVLCQPMASSLYKWSYSMCCLLRVFLHSSCMPSSSQSPPTALLTLAHLLCSLAPTPPLLPRSFAPTPPLHPPPLPLQVRFPPTRQTTQCTLADMFYPCLCKQQQQQQQPPHRSRRSRRCRRCGRRCRGAREGPVSVSATG